MSDHVERYDDEIDLRAYLEVLWRRKWVLVLLVVLAVAAAFALTRAMEPVYEAEATVLIRADAPGLGIVQGQGASTTLSAETALQMLGSRQLARAVATDLASAGMLHPELFQGSGDREAWILQRITAQRVGSTPILRVRAEATAPETAAAMANAAVRALERSMMEATQNDLRAAGEFTEGQLERVRQDLEELEKRAGAGSLLGEGELARERRVLEDLYASLLRQQENVRMQLAVQSSPLQVIDLAAPPLATVRPRLILNVAVAVVLGGFVGLAFVFVLEFFDVRVRSAHQIEELLGAPLLAQVPRDRALESAPARPSVEVVRGAENRGVEEAGSRVARRDGLARLGAGKEF